MDETTLPPVKEPRTWRTVVPRIWRGAAELVGKYPDRALIVFLLAFGVAVVL